MCNFLLDARNSIRDGFAYLGAYFKETSTFVNILDILLVSGLLFLVWLLFRKSRAFASLAVFVGGWCALTFLAALCGFNAFASVLLYLLRCGVFGGIVFLEVKIVENNSKNGEFTLTEKIKAFFSKQQSATAVGAPIDALCQAAVDLSRSRTGCLIVIERKNKLDDLIHTGVDIDAVVSPYLIRNIFYEGAPLHDGALIIRHGRVFAAGCILPITHRLDVDPDLGTRHRAAIGMSESTDAVVIVVSEETGVISIACNGTFTRDYTHRTLKNELTRLLNETTADDEED